MKLHSVLLCCIATLPLIAERAFCEDIPAEKPKATGLRLFNTDVFGKPTTEAIVLLKEANPGDLDPETVMVDVDQGRYIAATVRYPKDIAFEDARESLNRVYGKWETETFANDPGMGIWRNEDDEFSVQLAQDGFSIEVVYIKYSLVADDKLSESFSRALDVMQDEENAGRTIAAMHALLRNGEFAAFYRTHCHEQLRARMSEAEFVEQMRGDLGPRIKQLIESIEEAIRLEKGMDTFGARYSVRDANEYEFALMDVRRRGGKDQLWRLGLRKEEGAWKVKDWE